MRLFFLFFFHFLYFNTKNQIRMLKKLDIYYFEIKLFFSFIVFFFFQRTHLIIIIIIIIQVFRSPKNKFLNIYTSPFDWYKIYLACCSCWIVYYACLKSTWQLRGCAKNDDNKRGRRSLFFFFFDLQQLI